MSIDLLLFDCDGVLVDSELLAIRADLAELLVEGITSFTLDDLIRRFSGVSQADMLATIERETGRRIRPDFSERIERRVQREMRAYLRAMPGASRVLTKLNLAKCVASSSAPRKLDLTLRLAGLKKHFAPNIFSAQEVRQGKPAPDLFLHAARMMSVDPQKCCVVEDSIAGVTAGIAAGMQVVGFVGGSHCSADHGQYLTGLGATTIIHHWHQLPSVLGQLSA